MQHYTDRLRQCVNAGWVSLIQLTKSVQDHAVRWGQLEINLRPRNHLRR